MENGETVAAIMEYKKRKFMYRDGNYAEILLTIKDSTDAQAVVSKVISVLKDFYIESGMMVKVSATSSWRASPAA